MTRFLTEIPCTSHMMKQSCKFKNLNNEHKNNIVPVLFWNVLDCKLNIETLFLKVIGYSIGYYIPDLNTIT